MPLCLESMEYFVSPFPGNHRIKDQAGVPEIIHIKSSRLFLHISSSTKSVENFLLAFPGFSKFLENQESLDTPVFPGLFPGFSACAKKARNPRILVQNSTESQAPLAGEKTKREIIYYFK